MSGDMATAQLRVVNLDAPDVNQITGDVAFFDDNGDPIDFKSSDGLAFAPVVTATAIGTAAKTTTSPAPAVNSIVPIKFTNGNSAASATVAFNGGSAKPCLLGGAASASAKLVIAAGGVALFWYDGTSLHQIGAYT